MRRFQTSEFRCQIWLAAAAGAALLASATLLAQATRPQPGVRLPMSQLEAQMFHVSAGRRLKPTTWPNGARVAVGLSFDVDNATAELATGNLISEVISRGEYGAIDGVPRILRLLDQHQIPASFFIPAVSHLLHPGMIPSILGALIIAWLGKFKRMGLTALLVQAVYGVLIVAFAMSRVLWVSDILLFFTGTALMVVFSTVTSLVQMIAPNEMRGRVMSIYMLAFRGGMPIGSLVSGYLATLIGAPMVIGINGALLVVVAIYFLTRNHGVLET